MAKKNTAAANQGAASDPLLPVVGVPGTYEWCEEVVECMHAAWRGRETSERGFLAAVRAAVEHRIWETLSPPPPHDPYTSLDNLIRRTADEGQAENMQLVIKFSGIADEAASRGDDAPPWATHAAPAEQAYADSDALDPEVALGEALLAQFAAQMGLQPEGDEDLAARRPVGIPAGIQAGAVAGQRGASAASSAEPRMSPAQRKRERLEREHPELIDAVEAGEMTLKQALVEAGIEKAPRTIDKLQKLWQTASDEERERFLSWLDEQMAKQRKREYQEEVYGEDT